PDPPPGRAGAGAGDGDPDRHAGHPEHDPGGEGPPDLLGDAGGPEVRDADDEPVAGEPVPAGRVRGRGGGGGEPVPGRAAAADGAAGGGGGGPLRGGGG